MGAINKIKTILKFMLILILFIKIFNVAY